MIFVSLAQRIAPAGFAPAVLCGCASRECSVSAPPRAARELRVMTFDLRVRTIPDGPKIWNQGRGAVVEPVCAFDPDLPGTQEGLDSMATDLREQLGGYTFLGAGRSDGKLRGEMWGPLL